MLKTLTISLAIAAAIVANAMNQQDKGSCCGDKPAVAKEDAFMMEAHKMMMAAEGKMACCKTTAAKAVAKGSAGCCESTGGKHANGTKAKASTKAKAKKVATTKAK